MADSIAVILSVAAIIMSIALVVVSNKRHKSLRRRLQRLRERLGFSENMLRAAYARRATDDLAKAGRAPAFPVEFRSQHAEDILLYELFRGQDTGFFIEVGGFDGYSYAVTYALEAVGWRGLLVEGLPGPAEAARRCRPNSRVVQAAVSRRGSSGTATFTQFADDDTPDELCSFLEMDPGRDVSRPRSAPAGRLEVPLTTMDDVLAGHEGPIDLAVIDVEGGELNLLDGFDLARFRPRVILIEDHDLGADSPIGTYLKARGYVDGAWIAFNRLMVRDDEPALLLRVRELTHTPDEGTRPPGSPPDNRPNHQP